MPKTPKTPAKSKTKSTPNKTPPKKKESKPFIDDEAAADSDDGVLVDKPSMDSPSQRPDLDHPEDQGTEDEYEQDFINDGDPFADVDSYSLKYPSITPPPLPAKRRPAERHQSRSPYRSPSPFESRRSQTEDDVPSLPTASKNKFRGNRTAEGVSVIHSLSKKNKTSEVIELPDTSDEDLAAMDVGDTMYRKTTGVKASALPPSLLTRSAAALLESETKAPASSSRKVKAKREDPASETVEESPAVINGVMNAAMIAFVNGFLSDKRDATASTEAESSRPKPRPKYRVDHDKLALEFAMAESLKSPAKISTKPRYSPDWDPPAVGDLLEDVERDKKHTPPAVSPAKRKGKEKARALSPKPELEDVTSDEDPPPKKKKTAVVSKARSGTSGSGKKNVNIEQEDSPEPDVKPDNDLSSYLVRLGYPTVSANGLSDSSSPLTMAQFQRVSSGDSAVPVDDEADKDAGSTEEVDTVFLEDIEVYKAYFNPKAKCGVFDLRLQATSLRPTYVVLHPVPGGRRLVAAYDRNRNSLEDIDTSTGGHINWESWYNQNPRMLAGNSVGAIVFQEAAPNFVNISRISPLRLNTRISAGSSSTYRLHIDDRVAVCVSVICATESHLVAPKRIGVRSERMRKWVSGVMHDQEWERFESVTCLLFHEQTMYTQITDKAISFQTMISPDPRSAQNSSPAEQRSHRSIPSTMFSSSSPGKPAASREPPKYSSSMKTLLAHNDSVPVYDARRIVVDFNRDLGRLGDVLPLFPGEIPVGSYTVVGYTLSSYMAALSGTSDRVPHVGCNILWAIVCGTPAAGTRA
ncbi:hypothetical protein B0H16DRAFT_1521466 [Mycena metata]|uniref:Uncharacterized protein n=1 Tax=Mycena metata TaxID=1033252 RepID=A0AAD7NMI7_9AGAR|nr:hypothetical protein B0H16DRAFT_1521466 [Mycena metata]